MSGMSAATSMMPDTSFLSKLVLGGFNGAALKIGEGALGLSPLGFSFGQLFGYAAIGMAAFLATDVIGSMFALSAYDGPSAASYLSFNGKNIAGIAVGGTINGLVYFMLMKIDAVRNMGWFGAAIVGWFAYSIYRAAMDARIVPPPKTT